MEPSLLVIAGPLTGTVVPLAESISIGRGDKNTLRLKQHSVSRVHCRIESEADKIKLVDQSSYGTFINGVPVREHYLEHGDQIKIGDSLLLVVLEEGRSSPSGNSMQFESEDLASCSQTWLPTQQIQLLVSDATKSIGVTPQRATHDLRVLLDLARSVNSHSTVDSLQREVLECIFSLIPAERAVIILLNETTNDIASTYSLDGTATGKEPMRVSQTVVRQVLEQGAALMSNNIPNVNPYLDAESLVATRTRSLICAPLVNRQRIFGMIYLTSTNPTLSFDETHLHLAAAIASISSLAIEKLRYIEWLQDERERLQEELDLKHSMIGDSLKMREVLRVLGRAAPTDSNVLVLGASGTGKELVARAIHKNSPRSEKPFIAVNCAALTETLLESELFGHEKGAFTGAIAQKKGKLEVADGGTLFLDEVGELDSALQAKLLRALQERTFERVGGTRQISVNIRLIAATNKNLREAIATGAFREDLYYRLNVIEIELPTLGERREDIILLAQYFAARFSDKCKRRVEEISPEARACLMAYDWPGNIRELQNAIERAVVLGTSPSIMPEDLPETIRCKTLTVEGSNAGFYEALLQTKKQLILNAFALANGDHLIAAKQLGIHPNNLHRLIRTLNLRSDLTRT